MGWNCGMMASFHFSSRSKKPARGQADGGSPRNRKFRSWLAERRRRSRRQGPAATKSDVPGQSTTQMEIQL
jgi:hypothetical protein